MMNALRVAFCSLLLLVATAPLLAQGTYTQIDYPGATETYCYGINAAGDTVGYYKVSGGLLRGFLLSGGHYTRIDYPGSPYTTVSGINDNGQIVGVGFTTSNIGFVYEIATQSFTTISYPDANLTVPYAINNAGTIVGYYAHRSNSTFEGFEINGTTFSSISPPGEHGTLVFGISSSGRAVGYFYPQAGATINFIFEHGKYNPVLIPNASVYGINPVGNALIGVQDLSPTGSAGFIYQNKILTTLQFPGSNATGAFGINNTGSVVGYFYDAGGVIHGFRWTPPADAPKP